MFACIQGRMKSDLVVGVLREPTTKEGRLSFMVSGFLIFMGANITKTPDEYHFANLGKMIADQEKRFYKTPNFFYYLLDVV